MTTLIVIVIVTVILIIALISLGKSNEELEQEHHKTIDTLARNIAAREQHDSESKDTPSPQIHKYSRPMSKMIYEEIENGIAVSIRENSLEECTMFVELRGLYYRTEAEQERAGRLVDREKVRLVKEPDNPKDPYAIKVETLDGYTIGYIPEYLSEKLSRNFEYLQEDESYVSIREYDAIPTINVYFMVLGKSGFYWNKYLMDGQTFHEYRDRYPELQQNLYVMGNENPKQVADIWEKLYQAHPDDPYIEFKYMEAEDHFGKYERVIELATDLREKLNLWAFGRVEHFISRAKRKLREHHDIEISQQFAAQYQEGYDLLQKKEYEAALEKLLPCMKGTYRVQALPKNICKCYEKLKRNDEGIAFAKDAIQKAWLTEYTIVALQKYISKYSAS